MTALMIYDLIEAQLKVGGLLYKASEFVTDDGIVTRVETGCTPDLYVMHPNTLPAFVEMCNENGIPIIALEEYAKAKQEAWEKRHPKPGEITP